MTDLLLTLASIAFVLVAVFYTVKFAVWLVRASILAPYVRHEKRARTARRIVDAQEAKRVRQRG